VIPFRPVQRLTDLTTPEVTDLFTTVQKVEKMLARKYFGSPGSSQGKIADGSFNIAIQDGKESGQTVPHVHCHIIPRTKDSKDGDVIYDRLEGEEGNVGGGLWDARPTQEGRFPRIEDSQRKPRSAEDMNKEAASYKEHMKMVD
jgi:bis(5'-adenosyl)-triphosphatase